MITTEEERTARRALKQSGAAGFHRWALAVRFGGMGNRPTSGASVPSALDRPFFRAKSYARLGEIDEALKCLEQAYQQRECLLILLKTLEWWDPLRSEARFQDLVRRVGIP